MSTPADEAVEILRDLIRFESVNDGTGRGKGEREAAEYVAAKLSEVGLEPTVLESATNRTSVVARIEGEDRSRGALLIHGHLDVVPAEPKQWTYDPFAAEVADGCVWGRGPVDVPNRAPVRRAGAGHPRRAGSEQPREGSPAPDAGAGAGGGVGVWSSASVISGSGRLEWVDG